MAQSTSNIVSNPANPLTTTVPGLVSSAIGNIGNQFSSLLNSPSTLSSTQNSQNQATGLASLTPNLSTGVNQSAYASPTGTVTPIATKPTSTGGFINLANPTSTPASTPSNAGGGTTGTGGVNSYGLTSSSPNWYQLQPGESIANYNARVNTSGNIAAATSTPSSPTPAQTAAATYNGGVNSSGQGLPGYVPVPQINAPSNPNTATGSTFNNDVGTESQIAAQPSAAFTTAENNYNSAAQQLAALQANAAQQNANIQGSRTNLAEAGGEQGILQNLVSGQESALTGEMTAEQQAAANATAQQSAEQSGLQGAAGLVAPTAANPYGTYNPATLATTGYGQGAGSTSGGAAAAGGVQTQVGQGAAVQNMTGIFNQAQGLASSLTSAINASGYNPNQGIGPATTFANGINQWLQTNSGNPQYQNVANLVSEVANKYAAILNQSGGTPTSVSQVQQQIINGLASGQDIEKVLGSLATNAQTSINALQNASQNNSASGTTNGPSNTNTSSQYDW
jgi:hypothetical protein